MSENCDSSRQNNESWTLGANGTVETNSRRMLMTSAAAAGAGIVAGMLVEANPAGAADGETITVGGSFIGDTTTLTTSGGGAALTGVDATTSAGGGTGVMGQSTDNTGVSGTSIQGPGVKGSSEFGNGIQGASAFGTGVSASSNAGTALAVTGKANFSRSGIATIPSGDNAVTVTGVPLTSTSLVLATLQQLRNVGFALTTVAAVVPSTATSSFVIYLNQNVSTPTPVAWFVVN
jgi:hypothetical protein